MCVHVCMCTCLCMYVPGTWAWLCKYVCTCAFLCMTLCIICVCVVSVLSMYVDNMLMFHQLEKLTWLQSINLKHREEGGGREGGREGGGLTAVAPYLSWMLRDLPFLTLSLRSASIVLGTETRMYSSTSSV